MTQKIQRPNCAACSGSGILNALRCRFCDGTGLTNVMAQNFIDNHQCQCEFTQEKFCAICNRDCHHTFTPTFTTTGTTGDTTLTGSLTWPANDSSGNTTQTFQT